MAAILDNDPRLGRRRREFLESPIFKMGLWAEEHSAQLDPKENRRYRTCSRQVSGTFSVRLPRWN